MSGGKCPAFALVGRRAVGAPASKPRERFHRCRSPQNIRHWLRSRAGRLLRALAMRTLNADIYAMFWHVSVNSVPRSQQSSQSHRMHRTDAAYSCRSDTFVVYGRICLPVCVCAVLGRQTRIGPMNHALGAHRLQLGLVTVFERVYHLGL